MFDYRICSGFVTEIDPTKVYRAIPKRVDTIGSNKDWVEFAGLPDCYLCRSAAMLKTYVDGKFRCEACARLNVPITELPWLKVKKTKTDSDLWRRWELRERNPNANQKTLRHGDVCRYVGGSVVLVIGPMKCYDELCSLRGKVEQEYEECKGHCHLTQLVDYIGLKHRAIESLSIASIIGNVAEEVK